ncbi:MAG: LPS assembly lipoprotein LptE [Nitrospira sp.]
MLGAEFTVSRKQERRGPFVPILNTLVSALLVSTVAACGYQFRVEGAGPTIGGTSATSSQEPPPRLIIRTLINGSFEPNLETRYTNYLREEFSTGSGAQVVPESEAADLVLSGQILSVIVPTLSFSRTATLESRTEVVVLARVEDVRSRKVVWSQVVKGASEFFVTTDLQFNRALQNRAIEQAGRFVAADLAARFLLQLETGALTKQVSAPAPVPH